jgi:regulator of CtrA degradation
MGRESSNTGKAAAGVTVSFGERFAASAQFDDVYKQGMSLVERAAAYLDGAGRKEARLLKPPVSLVYATESMRLTTRLLELASWLLIRRALRDGDISREEASRKRERVNLRNFGRSEHISHVTSLPSGLQSLINESFALGERIKQIDRSLQEAPDGVTPRDANPVAAQLADLRAAFSSLAR